MPSQRKTEPSADMRVVAHTCWELYVALRDEGFTRAQAMDLVKESMRVAVAGDAQPS